MPLLPVDFPTDMRYRLTDHTADFGIQAFGRDLARLFENAAFALSDLITDTDRLAGAQTLCLTVSGVDQNDLLMNWLREVLYLWNGKGLLVKETRIRQTGDLEMAAHVIHDPYDRNVHEIRNEIKAVTYHQLEVGCNADGGWYANFIVDV